MSDLFSIIVLLYNNAEYLIDCLESILIQDYPSVEIIVVDDGSVIFDKNYIISYLKTNKRENICNYVVYQNEMNYGTVKSANGAIKICKGNYIKLLAADDALYNEHSLSYAAELLRQSPCGIVTGDVMKCDIALKPIAKYRNRLPNRLNRLAPMDVFRRLCVHNDIVAGGVFFTKTFFDTYGYFDESYRLIEDWPTWLNATRRGCRFLYSSFYAVRYRSNGGIGTSVNPIYMSDKQRVMDNIIVPAKKQIGLLWYIKAKLSYHIINSKFLRKIYGSFFRNRK